MSEPTMHGSSDDWNKLKHLVDLSAENARLKAEVERLKAYNEEALAHIAKEERKSRECLDMEQAENARLKADAQLVVKHLDEACADNLRLKADVVELADALKLASEVGIKVADEVTRLKAEVERLRASSFVTAVPVEQYERVVKAGDDMAFHYQELVRIEWGPMTSHIPPSVIRWTAAKEGKPSV